MGDGKIEQAIINNGCKFVCERKKERERERESL